MVRFGKANNRRVTYILQVDKDTTGSQINWDNDGNSITPNVVDAFPDTADNDTAQVIRFVDDYIEPGANTLPTSPAIFETEADENVDLNIYYEASDALPIGLDDDKGHLLAPIGTKVTCSVVNSLVDYNSQNNLQGGNYDLFLKVKSWNGNELELFGPGLITNPSGQGLATSNNALGWSDQSTIYGTHYVWFWREDGSYTTAVIDRVSEISTTGPDFYITKLIIRNNSHQEKVGLSYYNCFSFGNGVESNRVRDDFNESFILNGVKASTVLEEPYEEERRKHGLIYSGIYNSVSGVNNLNQFIQAEKITKDLMPSYGSIQKLYARDKDLITLCEDKIIRVYVDKDILYNADGNTQLLATNRVLGTAEPFRGNFGISKNPESFAAESFRVYFTDKQRGAVLRLSMDGLTPISDAGMHDYFRDNLPLNEVLLGSYDAHKGNYNITMFKNQYRGDFSHDTSVRPRLVRENGGETLIGCTNSRALNYDPNANTSCKDCCEYPPFAETITYNEAVKGWVSFKSFLPEFAISSVNQYYTMKQGMLWKHHQETTPESRNTFYDVFEESSITPVLNTNPGVIKNFNTLNYEGSQTKIDIHLTDNDYYNLHEKKGWYVEEIHTDKQDGTLNEFIEKEGKWFNYIKGSCKELDTAAFNFQGLGVTNVVTEECLPCATAPVVGCTDSSATNYNASATVDDGSCTYLPVSGCTDPTATNYDATATVDDGSCTYPIVRGCMDPTATNYDPTATFDDGSCTYAPSLNCVTQPVTWTWDGTNLTINTTAFNPTVLFPNTNSSIYPTQTKLLRSDGTEVKWMYYNPASPVWYGTTSNTFTWSNSGFPYFAPTNVPNTPFSNITPGNYTIVHTVFDTNVISGNILSQCSINITIV